MLVDCLLLFAFYGFGFDMVYGFGLIWVCGCGWFGGLCFVWLCCLLVVWIVGAALTLCLVVYCDSAGCLDGVADSDWF